jgi:hypothetical protein
MLFFNVILFVILFNKMNYSNKCIISKNYIKNNNTYIKMFFNYSNFNDDFMHNIISLF